MPGELNHDARREARQEEGRGHVPGLVPGDVRAEPARHRLVEAQREEEAAQPARQVEQAEDEAAPPALPHAQQHDQHEQHVNESHAHRREPSTRTTDAAADERADVFRSPARSRFRSL